MNRKAVPAIHPRFPPRPWAYAAMRELEDQQIGGGVGAPVPPARTVPRMCSRRNQA